MLCVNTKGGRTEHTTQSWNMFQSGLNYSTTARQWVLNSIRSFQRNLVKKTKTSNNLHFHFKYSKRCQLQITFKSFSQLHVVNKTIKILTKTQLWCTHTPYIALSLTSSSFMCSLPGGFSGFLLLRLFLTQVTDCLSFVDV